MRIAVLSQTDTPWTGPYARAFMEAGHEVRVFSFHTDPLEGVDVVNLCPPRPPWVRREIWYARHALRLRRLLREFAPDVVFSAYMSSNSVAGALAWKGPHVVSARGGDVLRNEFGELPTWPWLHRILIQYVCRRASAVHAVSEGLAEGLVAFGVPRERIHMFPLGAVIEQYPFRQRSEPANGVPRLLCNRYNGLIYANHVVIDGLARLRDRGRDFRCVMAGGGPLLQERKEQARRLNLDQVEFVGRVPFRRMHELLDSSDIFVSATMSDGTSTSLLEAMASGLFPVVTRIRGMTDWLRDGETALMFGVGDAEGLSRALERAMDDHELRSRAAVENRKLVEARGSRRENMARMVALLEEACRKG